MHSLPSYNRTAILVQDDIVVGIKYSAFSLAVMRGPVTQCWPRSYEAAGWAFQEHLLRERGLTGARPCALRPPAFFHPFCFCWDEDDILEAQRPPCDWEDTFHTKDGKSEGLREPGSWLPPGPIPWLGTA